jgi:hypothetical protein
MLIRAAAAAGTIALLTGSTFAAAPEPAAPPTHTINDLAGRWAGTGTIKFTNGQSQPYKCTVTYFVTGNGVGVKQTLRCQTQDDNKLEIASTMQVSAGAINGTWEENQHAMSGTVRGKVTPTGYQALAQNQFFQAAFEINQVSPCEQQVTIRPSRDVALISARLRKC